MPDDPDNPVLADDGEIVLPAKMELRSTADLAERIRAAGASGAVVRLDASGVELVTSPAAQLLMAAAADGYRFEVDKPSADFTECLAALGIDLEMLDNLGDRI